jgi:hypothetical protein
MTDASDLRNREFIVPPITPAQAAAVRLHVTTHAHDADDARALLDALGIGEA